MSFKEQMGRLKKWCGEYKTEIIITVVGAAGCGALCYGAKKLNDYVNARMEISLDALHDREAADNFEFDMFANGVRKQFLDAGYGDTVDIITESGAVDRLRSVIQDENCLCALKHGNKVLVMAQEVPAGRAMEVVSCALDDFSRIDDLEIWIGGTIKE